MRKKIDTNFTDFLTLSYGYPFEGLKRAIQEDIAFIGVDAGSTDPDPYYLRSGKAFVKEMQIRRDLEPAICSIKSYQNQRH